jgi:CRP-like cAMP-binding protein
MQADELAGLALFQDLAPEYLRLLAPLFRRVTIADGEEIFRQGDEAKDLYMLESGEIAVQVALYDGGRLDVTTVQPGGLCGWSAVLGRSQYTASAICRGDSTALVVQGSDLRQVIQTHAPLGQLLVERMAQLAGNRSDGLHNQLMKMFEK